MTAQEFNQKFKEKVAKERGIIAEAVDSIRECDQRRLYLELGYTSLFAYLTQEILYSPAAAQRRIHAARLAKAIPEIIQKIKSGSLNLTTLSLAAQAIKSKEKIVNEMIISETITSPENTASSLKKQLSTNDKQNLINKIENLGSNEAQLKIAKTLDLPVIHYEKQKIQQDESVRIETTLSKKQMQKIKRVKELLSHNHPNPTLADLVEILADFYLSKRDLLIKKEKVARPGATSAAEVDQISVSKQPLDSTFSRVLRTSRSIPISLKRKVFKRDQHCQFRSKDGKICGTKYQIEAHHIQPVWANGPATEDNLQVLCRAHNQYTYRKQAGIEFK